MTVVDHGCDVGLVCTGYLVGTARAAAEKLRARGIGARVDHHPSLKPFDRTLLLDLASKVGGIVTMENHCTSGGLYSLVAETLACNGEELGRRQGREIPSAGSSIQLTGPSPL